VEIIELLKSGGKKIKKDLRKTRQIRFCHEAQLAREQLMDTLESVSGDLEVGHIRLLATAIWNVVFLLGKTKSNFHCKEFMQIRKDAKNLLKEAKAKCRKTVKQDKQGDLPIRK
jgi:hypothetical protein